MLAIRLLGQFNVTLDGRPVVLPMRPAQLLLAWLVLNVGAPQPREALADRLWPDSSAENARSNLRHALWQLRAAIDPQADAPTAHLLHDAHHITFNPDCPYTLDVDTLARERRFWTTADLLAAAEAYRGELLPGFYEPWIVLERDRLAAVYERRMAALLDRLEADGHWDELMTWAERWIAKGGAPEPAYRALMLAYAARGDAGRVLATYRRCRQNLLVELGVEPSVETRALAERARHLHQTGIGAAPDLPMAVDPADPASFERRRAEIYRRAAQRSNRLALAALLGMAAAVGVAVASRRR